MSDKQNEPKLTYALDESGKMVYIRNVVERGLACKCRCPKCNKSLVAKLGHEGGRQPHFAHQKDAVCHGSYMSALHKLAEEIICQEKAVKAPAYKEFEEKMLHFKQVNAEIRIERNDLQPDIRGVTEDDKIWYVEIKNTNEVDDKKRERLINSNISCLEIDVSEQILENLKTFLLESADCREWINNPNYDEQIASNNRKRVDIAEKALFEGKKILIPPCDNFEKREVVLDTIIVVNKQEDGLYTRLECTTPDAEKLVINICIEDNLKEIEESVSSKFECSEVFICVDEMPLAKDITYNDLSISSLLYYKEIIETPATQSLSNNKPDETFEEHYRAISEYDKHLTEQGYYTPDLGIRANIIKREIVGQKMYILYSAYIVVAAVCQYHIDIVEVTNGKISKRRLGDFEHMGAAICNFNHRVKVQTDLMCP